MERLPRPQRDRVLVQFGSDKETKTDSGIIVPATQTDDEIIRSTVLAVPCFEKSPRRRRVSGL